MKKTEYRLVLNGFQKNAQIPLFANYLETEHRYNKPVLEQMINNNAGILMQCRKKKKAETLQADLEKLGGKIEIEELFADKTLPFAVSKSVFNLVEKDLSKILRTNSNLSIFLVTLQINKDSNTAPSVIFAEKDLAPYLRASDSILPVDNNRFLVLGYSTDARGTGSLFKKLSNAMREVYGNDLKFDVGFSLFPDQAQDLPELLRIADKNHVSGNIKNPDLNIKKTKDAADLKAMPAPKYLNKTEFLTSIFSEARGRGFQLLSSMNPDILWVGLSKIPKKSQKAFLSSLPFDSALLPDLLKKMKNNQKPLESEKAVRSFESVIRKMEFKQTLKERKKTYERVLFKLHDLKSLPILPEIATRVNNADLKSVSGLNDLSKMISANKPLSANMLKILNSDFYGFREKIKSIKDALQILGASEIRNLCLCLSAVEILGQADTTGFYSPKNLWHHSIGTALIADYLCRYLAEYKNANAFTAGLFHDFGKIFLMKNIRNVYNKTFSNVIMNKVPFYSSEEENFGLNHGKIGKIISSNWNLPQHISEAIAFHHNPTQAPEHSALAAITGLADYLYYQAAKSDDQLPNVVELSPYLTLSHISCLKKVYTLFDYNYLKFLTRESGALLLNNQRLFSLIDF